MSLSRFPWTLRSKGDGEGAHQLLGLVLRVLQHHESYFRYKTTSPISETTT